MFYIESIRILPVSSHVNVSYGYLAISVSISSAHDRGSYANFVSKSTECLSRKRFDEEAAF